MQELRNDGKLSSRDYWDEVLVQADLPRISTRRAYHQRITMDFVDEFISKGDYKSFFEVGCGSSGWLPYFALKYNLVVSGIDYSVPGCRLAEQNLKMLEIPYGEIICKDIFEPDCTGGKKYELFMATMPVTIFGHPLPCSRSASTRRCRLSGAGSLRKARASATDGMRPARSR